MATGWGHDSSHSSSQSQSLSRPPVPPGGSGTSQSPIARSGGCSAEPPPVSSAALSPRPACRPRCIRYPHSARSAARRAGRCGGGGDLAAVSQRSEFGSALDPLAFPIAVAVVTGAVIATAIALGLIARRAMARWATVLVSGLGVDALAALLAVGDHLRNPPHCS